MGEPELVAVEATEKRFRALTHEPSKADIDEDSRGMWPADQYTFRLRNEGAIRIVEPETQKSAAKKAASKPKAKAKKATAAKAATSPASTTLQGVGAGITGEPLVGLTDAERAALPSLSSAQPGATTGVGFSGEEI